ncbi:Uma2 family endonuclease [Streptomyces olivochromogenes]|uniref:Uma2 family endonuclease n=1 Tax=Streptomyces olivochromogenes TaxID=1963 RepID=UPI001F488F6C|nr:Uma2 family endonuclease [Streptomyces olivochromogenes]MCF3136613.1 Uma2 family endonuclease [Streptomyces olivochromogenes]
MDSFDGDCLLTDNEWEELVWVWKQTDVPKGCKVEIVKGRITVAPYSAVSHHRLVEPMARHLIGAIPDSWGVYQRLALAVSSRHELYVPDLAVVPEEVLRRGDDCLAPADAAELVVEVTSARTAETDRTTKVAGYADAGVPLYLLVDRLAPGGPTVVLYGEPKGGVYRVLHACGFGAAVDLPRPIGFTLDAGLFPAK